MVVPCDQNTSLAGCSCNGTLNDTLTEFDEIFAEGDLADNSLADGNDFLGISPVMWTIILLALLSLGLGIIYIFKKK